MSFSRSKVARFQDSATGKRDPSPPSPNLAVSKGPKSLSYANRTSNLTNATPQSKPKSPRCNSANAPQKSKMPTLVSDARLRSRSCGDKQELSAAGKRDAEVKPEQDNQLTTVENPEIANPTVSPEVARAATAPTFETAEKLSLESETVTNVTEPELITNELLSMGGEDDMGIFSGQEIDIRLKDDDSEAVESKELMSTLMGISDENVPELEKKNPMPMAKSASGIPVKRVGTFSKVKSPQPAPRGAKVAASFLTNPSAKPSETGSTLKKPTQLKSSSVISTVTLSTPAGAASGKLKPSTRNLETQFIAKKKRFMMLKKTALEQQQPALDLYNQLIALKKQVLEKSGKELPLENFRVVECKDLVQAQDAVKSEQHAAEQAKLARKEIKRIGDEELDNYLQTVASDLPLKTLEFCRSVIKKREDVIDMLNECQNMDHKLIKTSMEKLKTENNQLIMQIETDLHSHGEVIGDAMSQFFTVCQKKAMDNMGQDVIRELENKLDAALQEVKEAADAKIMLAEEKSKEINYLNKKIKDMEMELDAQQIASSEAKEKASSNDTSVKQLKVKLRDTETKYKDFEKKNQELQKTLRKLQEKYNSTEESWTIKNRDLDKQLKLKETIIHKLTSDRSALETRMNTLQDILGEKDKTFDTERKKFSAQIKELSANIEDVTAEKNLLETKCNSLKKEIVHMESQAQQALNLVRNDLEEKPSGLSEGFESQRERQLRIELEATKIALEEASRKLKMYKEEKVRFIETIRKMTNDKNNGNEEKLMKALVEKEELITKLEQELVESKEDLNLLKMRMEQEIAARDDLRRRLQLLESSDKQRLETIHSENLATLDAYKKKLLANEREIHQKNVQMKDMQNLLKLRDDLINMLKEKKDKLMMDNETLKAYSTKIYEQFKVVSNQLLEKNDKLVGAAVKLEDMQHSLSKAEERILEQKTNMYQLNDRRFKLQSETERLQEELQTLRQQVGDPEGFYSRSHSKLLRKF